MVIVLNHNCQIIIANEIQLHAIDMKTKIYHCLFAISLFSCTQPLTNATENQITEILQTTSSENLNFDWLLGEWVRVNQKDTTKTTFENWKKKTESEYAGFSYTLQNGDTVWQENVELIRMDQDWSFNVTQKGEPEQTRFKLTSIEPGTFICENPENEFPKKIEYVDAGDTLRAKISDGDREVLFDFVKKE